MCRLNIQTSDEDCVHTDAADCSSDFIPDALFLTPFNPTSQAGKRHIFSLFFFSFQKKVSIEERFLFFAVSRTCILYSLEARQTKPSTNRWILFK